MWVYGDRSRKVRPRQALRALTATLREVETTAAGAERHDRLTTAFLQAGELAQGIADAEFEAKGEDDASPAQEAASALLVALGRKLAASAWSGFLTIGPPTSAELMALALSPMPDEIEVKTPEGHAFYAVYPEAYLKAAGEKPWDAPPLVLGVRSIGTGLAALVAAVTNAEKVVTLRPTGHPAQREVRVSEGLRARLAAHAGPFAVVDEGPGVSGSSFGAVADLLEELGVAAARIVFLPSHGGDLGPEALPEHRARWATAARRPASFDGLIEDEPLAGWFEDLTGKITAIDDLSGGAWAKGRGDKPPTHPGLERRKFRLTTERGAWLAKFAGLGAQGEAKFARSRTLFRAGAGAEPLAFRRGFLLERWVEGTPGPQVNREGLVEHVGRYLGLRALAFPADAADGASLEDLAVMTRVNWAELKGQAAADVLPAPPIKAKSKPIHVDGRLHRWEWITTADERLIKTDALDHSCGHDLVGCQDV
ncbi:MAG: hypothetical protein JWP50_217, partial [Phenylobacterium sp.]|nr:hypothetical protein [Phenylobacterium sp.]